MEINNSKYTNDIIQKMSSFLLKNYSKENFERDAHPKTIGLVKAEFKVYENIPSYLKSGIFNSAKNYPAIVRFSNASHKIKSDLKKDIRGCSIKLLNINDNNRFSESIEKHTQDFLLMSNPTMPFGTIKIFRDTIVNTVDSPWYKILGWLIKNFRVYLKVVKSKKAHNSVTNIDYWSCTPYKLGNKIVKYKITPKVHENIILNNNKNYNKLKINLKKQLAIQDVAFDFCIQLFDNEKTTPLNDISIPWDENKHPFIKIACLRIPQQSTKDHLILDKKISFSPANSLAKNRPVAEMNLERIKIYKALSSLRKKQNLTKAFFEPSLEDFKSL